MSNSSLVSGLSEASRARFSWVEVSQKVRNNIFKKAIDNDHRVPRRLENRLARSFDSSLSAGYRDFGLNLRFEKPGKTWHICELQLQLRSLDELKDNGGHKRYPLVIITCFFPTFWETSTQENLTPEASDRPETRLELLTRFSSIRFFPHFLIPSRIGPLKECPPQPSNFFQLSWELSRTR